MSQEKCWQWSILTALGLMSTMNSLKNLGISNLVSINKTNWLKTISRNSSLSTRPFAIIRTNINSPIIALSKNMNPHLKNKPINNNMKVIISHSLSVASPPLSKSNSHPNTTQLQVRYRIQIINCKKITWALININKSTKSHNISIATTTHHNFNPNTPKNPQPSPPNPQIN